MTLRILHWLAAALAGLWFAGSLYAQPPPRIGTALHNRADSTPPTATLALSRSERDWLRQHPIIRVAFDGHFPPYSYLDEEGHVVGLAVDVFALLERKLGVRFDIAPQTVWKELFAAAQRREVDVVATMGHRPEREAWFVFTRPYIFKALVILTRADDSAVRSADDLAGRPVALVRGYQYTGELLQQHPAIRPVWVDTMHDGLLAVATGKVDAAVSFLGAAHYLRARYQISNLKVAAVLERDRYSESIGVRNDWPTLALLLDRALADIDEAEMLALQQKWLGPSAGRTHPLISPELRWTLMLLLAGALLLTGGILAWNRQLRAQVRRHTRELEEQVHELERARHELAESEQRFRAIFNSTNDALFIHDIGTGAIVDVNQTMCDMWGVTRQEALRSNLEDLSAGTPPYTLKEALMWLDRAMANGPQLFEWQAKRKNGELFWVEVNMRRAYIGANERIVVSVRDITDRKQAEELYTQILSRVSDAFVALDRGWHYTYLNKQAAELFGREPEDLVGKHIWTEFPEGLGQPFHQHYERAMRDQIPVFFEEYFAPWDRWFENRVYPSQGGLTIFFHEITARKKAEEALRASEARFREVLERVQLIAVLLDTNGKVSFCNDFLLKLTGMTREEVLGSDWFDLVIPDSHPEVKELFLQGLKNGEIEPYFENPIRAADQTQKYIFWNNTILRDTAGQIIGTASIGEDITERRQAQQQAEEAARDLRRLNRLISICASTLDLEELLEKILDETTEMTGLEGGTICFVEDDQTLHLACHRNASHETVQDLSTHVVRVGECLCGNCALKGEPLILGNRRQVLAYASREALRNETITYHAAFPLNSGQRCVGVLCLFTRRDFKPDERSMRLIESIAPQIGTAMDNARLHGQTRQQAALLEKRVAERTTELQQANERLKELDRLKSMFIASMSHELRTPLNSIIGFSSILLNEWTGPLNDEQKENLDAVLRAGRHLLELVNDIIDLSKIEAGLLEIMPSSFDLVELLEEVRQTFAREAGQKGLKLAITSDRISLMTDRRRLLQVLANLVSNAVKYTETGEVSVRAELDHDHNSLTIEVQDTGIGISEAQLKELFQPFRRLESHLSPDVPGTGLGLYLTRKLVREVFQGDILVSSQPGQGSLFSVRMPAPLILAGEQT
ncbi:MAG: hypothetical protein Tsb0017_18900 [Geothermobacteraceae bacterium]